MKRFPLFVAIILPCFAMVAQEPSRVKVEWGFSKSLAMKTNYPHPRPSEFKIPRALKVDFPINGSGTLEYKMEIRIPRGYSPPFLIDVNSHQQESIGWKNYVTQHSLKPINTVTPMTPSQFDSSWIGVEVKLNATMNKNVIRLLGVATIQTVRIDKGVFGEGSGPIYTDIEKAGKKVHVELSANVGNMGRKTTYESNFQLNAISGKPYKILIDGPGGPLEAVVTCSAY